VASSSDLRGHKRTYLTILELANHALFKIVRYVLLRPLRPELDAKTKTCLPAKTRFCHLDEQAISHMHMGHPHVTFKRKYCQKFRIKISTCALCWLCWRSVGALLALCWRSVGALLALDSVDALLALCWRRSVGAWLALYWRSVGALLTVSWRYVDALLALC
jgi:hypothetical protein